MPQTLALLPIIISSTATTVLGANLLYLGTTALLYGAGILASGLISSIFQQKPSVPKPDDGSYNLKQNIPTLTIAYGTVKKGGDYAFLEETAGIAYHITVICGRRINAITQHYLHDDPVGLDGSGFVTSPAHYNSKVKIASRLGLDVGLPYSEIISTFPGTWVSDHRGDGLTTVLMMCLTVKQKDYLDVFPNQMPEHSCVIEGALLYDPRKDSTQPGGSGSHRFTDRNTWEFSRNLALMRLDHLTQPYGGKLSHADMYLPDWVNAANVCDQTVVNRQGSNENRYHGGLWFKLSNDPTEVGRILDEAAEMVVYERADGKIGVHAGEYVAPTVRLVEGGSFTISVDKNRSEANTVLAVRGKYTNRANAYNAEDCAIYGDPYGVVEDDTQRTKTFDNAAVQSHNHAQRKQKLTFLRANARKVSVEADYIEAKDARFSRFVRIHYPSRGLVEAVVEITSQVTLNLTEMKISFSGIVVPESLYSFDAATEEGVAGAVVSPLPNAGVPVPTGVLVAVQTEVISGGSSAAYALISWTGISDTLIYEVEYDRVTGSTGAVSVYSNAPDDQVRTGYLVDGQEYKIRVRALGGGSRSAFTEYVFVTATADPTPPSPVLSAAAVGGTGQISFSWTAPNSANYSAARLYINSVDSFTGASLVATEYGPPNISDGRVISGITAGTHYGFVVSINASGVPSTPVATGEITVT